ncbi:MULTISPECIES: hypothetical protein [Salinivibrio]|uniref:Uncharacterized protein n=2 Tax=Salinivibrio TaxID=51366 RepID=A0ABY7LGF6_9GAMM|nr:MULTISPECIES: hypothetical protein [Salinivibrio]ODP99535.1 hypothetical protein BGK46_10745 [Salinivibrio sp. DV]OOF08867.1 hypothetical protein BZG83_15615 [Salinivibrio sp. PR919]OOF09615.1 hypothetical protein BZG82_10175 [Salinivibrio sp. PR5]OOF17866.1 hypothetical protein BZG84_06070 [Salinivibrio sp. PR932]OOF20700.1 hypothetical protein BZJ17_11745 [Salinivibrio sp. IB574]
MSSPANVTIKNFTQQSITTQVTRDSWVEEDGASINNQVIPEGHERTFKVIAKTGHHGELDIDLIGGNSGQSLGVFYIKSIKDPQEGEKSLAVEPAKETVVMSAMGYRHTPGDEDLRRIDLVIIER